jgi:hypothetical protein
MDLSSALLPVIETPGHKSLVVFGSFDERPALTAAPHFRSTLVVSERLRAAPVDEAALRSRAVPTAEVLAELHRFDVIAFDDSFHLLPDLLQIETFERLGRYQELVVIEWDLYGTLCAFESAFIDDRAQRVQTRALINRVLHEGRVEVEQAVKGRHTEVFPARQALLDYFRYRHPEHYPFGEHEFLRRTGGVQYPLTLWHGFDVLKLRPYGWR